MTRIGLISDTHGFLDETVFEHFKDCDEVWHAGDFGGIEIANHLINGQTGRQTINKMNTNEHQQAGLQNAPEHGQTGRQTMFRGVYGNIDGNDIRAMYPEKLHFTCEKVNVFMQHIGGYPNRYALGVKDEIIEHQSKLFISGHSHILKIMYDDKLNCLHMNPGAAGKQGWQKVRTVIRFVIDGEEMRDCEVIEL